LLSDVASLRQSERAASGNGAVAKALNADAASLEQAGIKLNPETIQQLSVITDPINYIPFGATVGAVTKSEGSS
jgi:hypothetical protein